ncbi:MAG: TonB-dependent receptor, partial [Vicinamibacterales bacterium]
TGSDGTFTLQGIALGRQVLQITRSQFSTARVDVQVAAEGTAPLRVVLRVPGVREDVTVTARASTDKLSIDTPASTGSRLGLSPRETPASVTVVERSTIEQRGATDTQEILNSVPGMTAAAPPGSAGAVTYRGFGTAQITQLFNGITVQYDAIAARPVDSWIYEKVEVIGGPSTFLFGAGAVGGSINYVTRLPERDRNGAQFRASYGSYGTGEVDLGLNRTLGSGTVRNHVRFDLSRSGSDGFVTGSQRAALVTAASLLTDIGSKVSHTLALEYQNEEVDRPYWGTPLLLPTVGQGQINPATRFVNYNTGDGIYEQSVMWTRSLTEFRPSAKSTIRNTLYHYDALRDYRNVEVYRFNAANTLVSRSSPLLQRHDQQVTGDRVEVQQKGSIGRLPSDWAGGFDVSDNKQTRFPLSLSSTVSTVDPVTFPVETFFDIPGMVPGFNPDRTNEVSTVALFVENRTKLHNALSLVTGIRRDRIVLEGTNRRPATVSANNPAYFKNVYTPVTGRVGLSYEFLPSANVYVQYSTAADPPAGILATASFAQVRTFDLTTGRQSEGGVKFDFLKGRGVATAAVYSITRKNLSIADPLNPGTSIPVGQQSSRGFELASSLRATTAVLFQGNYAYTDASFDDFTENVGGVAVSRAGNVPTNTPAHVGNVWLTVTPIPALDLGMDGRWVSTRFADNANTIWDRGYSIFGAFASYRIKDRATLTGRVRNLTDEIYARSVTGTPMFFLGAPRTFELALRIGL